MRSKNCRDEGRSFHNKLDAAKAETADHSHDDDDVHDHYVGASCLLAIAGNVDKGLMIYNSWAACAGYQPAFVIERDPLKVDTGDAMP